jgi:N-acetylneuraminic acid mutarotase
LWEYGPSGNTWTENRNLTNVSSDSYDDKYSNIARSNASAFVMNNLGYTTTEESGSLSSLTSDTWEYNPTSDTWVKRTLFEAIARIGAVGVTVNGRGIVLTGRSGSLSFDNAYEFFPTAKYNAND